jgi:uncharacterized membrane protein required for colicin V production
MNLPINWFDVALAAVLIAGAVVGRKRGMSEELLPMMQWLAMVAVSAIAYQPLGRFVAEFTHMTLLWSYILTYLCILLVLRLVFGFVKSAVGEKLVGSDVFGGMEYYLGIFAGMIRFACILLAVLALLHSRYYSPQERAAEARMQRENFGSISFPTLGLIQASVFRESGSGRIIDKYLGQQLITATPAGTQLVERVGIARRREQAVSEALGERR